MVIKSVFGNTFNCTNPEIMDGRLLFFDDGHSVKILSNGANFSSIL